MGIFNMFDNRELWKIPEARTQPIADPSAIKNEDATVEKYKILTAWFEIPQPPSHALV